MSNLTKNHLLVWSTAFYEIAMSLQFSAFHLSTVHFESLFAFLQTDRKSLALFLSVYSFCKQWLRDGCGQSIFWLQF